MTHLHRVLIAFKKLDEWDNPFKGTIKTIQKITHIQTSNALHHSHLKVLNAYFDSVHTFSIMISKHSPGKCRKIMFSFCTFSLFLLHNGWWATDLVEGLFLVGPGSRTVEVYSVGAGPKVSATTASATSAWGATATSATA